MPELPEVETICSDLRRKILNKKITGFIVKKRRLIRNTLVVFKKALLNKKITGIARRGKLIIVKLSSGKFLLIHLKMTGQLIYQKGTKIIPGGHSLPRPGDGLPNNYSHIIFTFNDRSQLFFNDMRQFGYMQIVSQAELDNILANNYGIEPMLDNFTWENWQKVLQGRKTTIKALLVNQKVIAGIGNIYADEICHRAGIRPQRSVDKLTLNEKKKLWQSTEAIIRQAVKRRGTTFSDYVDADGNVGSFSRYLKVFGRQGKRCQRCQRGIIKKVRLVGRGTHYCPACQK